MIANCALKAIINFAVDSAAIVVVEALDRPLIAFASAAINLIACLSDVASLPSPYRMVGGNLGAVTTFLLKYFSLHSLPDDQQSITRWTSVNGKLIKN